MLARAATGLLVAGTLLGGAELAVRAWGGVEHAQVASPLVYQRQSAELDRPSAIARVHQWGFWQRHRPTQPPGLRVISLGASTTQGERVGPFSAYSGVLERGLEDASDHSVEVLNVGVGGIAARHVREDVRAAVSLPHKPDLVVVYSGNNEFLEIMALKSALPHWTSEQELARRRLWQLHGYRLLASQLVPHLNEPLGPPRAGEGTQHLGGEMTPADRRLVELLYEEALTDMVQIAKEAGVPLLLATVADNLEMRPFDESGRRGPVHDIALLEHTAALPDDQVASFLADGDRLTAHSWYELGVLLQKQGREALAIEALLWAENADTRPHRSSKVMRQALLDLAESHGAAVCDTAGALLDAGMFLDAHFFDSCHPRAQTHDLIGQTLLQCIADQELLPLARPPGLPPDPPDPLALDAYRQRLLDTPRDAQDDGTWKGALDAGHQAFIAARPDEARTWYQTAADRGAPGESVLRSKVLAAPYGTVSAPRVWPAFRDELEALGDPILSARWPP